MNEDNSLAATKKMIQELEYKLKLTSEEDYDKESSGQESHEEEYYEEDDNDEDFSFSFAFDGVSFPTISAEDAFDNGQIKPVFPLFNRDLLFPDGEDLESLRLKDRLPKVKKVFVEAEDDDFNATTSSTTGDEDIVGPYCEWSKKVVEAAPEGCKKSNSTGFSKIWRFKDFMHRCNSDGRDAFVFLNNTTPSSSTSTAAPVSVKREEKAATAGVEKENSSLKKVNGSGGVGGEVKKVKKVKKSKTAAMSAHEVYMRSKAKDGDRRRSYLPYRPELVGLFTNVYGGGLTRNMPPY